MPSRWTGQHDHLRRFGWLDGNATMAVGVLVRPNCAGKEIRKCLLLRPMRRSVCQRTVFPERLPHQANSEVCVCKLGRLPDPDFDLLECLKHRCIVVAPEKRRPHLLRDSRMKLVARKPVRTTVRMHLIARSHLSTASGNDHPLTPVTQASAPEAPRVQARPTPPSAPGSDRAAGPADTLEPCKGD